jgi:DNA-binding transcriptional MerR regulator
MPGNLPGMRRLHVELMTSGAFARASGLSRKALRLYDELGLLPPARVDPESGYRFYQPAQLEQARLVAWLRRLGMPLASIRAVSTLPPAHAAVADVVPASADPSAIVRFVVRCARGLAPGVIPDTCVSAETSGAIALRVSAETR